MRCLRVRSTNREEDEAEVRITEKHLRQIICEELEMLNEAPTPLSNFNIPTAASTDSKMGNNIKITTKDGRSGVSKRLGVKIVASRFLPAVTYDITALKILSWSPEAPDGQTVMEVSFIAAGKAQSSVKLKNKVALKEIADAIISGMSAEGETVTTPMGFDATLVVNYK